jgi:hypothetical protein
VARNANEAMVALMVGSAESAFDGSLESGGRFCVGAFGGNLASVADVLVSFNNGVWCSRNRSKTSSCKDNAALKCITVQHQKGFISVNCDGPYAQLVALIFVYGH